MERGERVVGDLGAGRRDRTDQAGLACRGIADQSHVCDGLELEDDIVLVSRSAQKRETGRLALRRRQCGIAESAVPALRHDESLAGLDHVDQDLAGRIPDHGADGNGKLEILAHEPCAVVAHAGPAVAGAAVRRMVVREKRSRLGVGDEHDVAAVTAVAPVGAAERLELLAVHRDTAVAALARTQVKRHGVDETDHVSLLNKELGRNRELDR